MPNRSIHDLRERIDELNMIILKALSERAEISKQIGEEKKRRNLPVFDAEREKEVISRILEANQGPLAAEDLESIFTEIMRISKKLQN